MQFEGDGMGSAPQSHSGTQFVLASFPCPQGVPFSPGRLTESRGLPRSLQVKPGSDIYDACCHFIQQVWSHGPT